MILIKEEKLHGLKQIQDIILEEHMQFYQNVCRVKDMITHQTNVGTYKCSFINVSFINFG